MDDQPLVPQHHQQQLTLPCNCFYKPIVEGQEEPKQISEPNLLSEFNKPLDNQFGSFLRTEKSLKIMLSEETK